ncbi:hypothetical protein SMACR_02042 [Sordaria macrospora]|nr:hypothetical protein SMACR_02042 [Sordaria macrospora]
MISMLKIQQMRITQGKRTVFFNENGEMIPKIKFTRFKNRHNIMEFKDEELQKVETPRGITVKTPEPDDTKTRLRNRLSTDRPEERTHMGTEEPHTMTQSSRSNHRDNRRREYHQLPGRPDSSSYMSHRDWNESQIGHFTNTVASPAPSAYSNTTICAPTATIAAYTSNHHGQFETIFSPHSTTISDPGEYQFSSRLRQGSVSSMPPLDYNPSRVGLFTNAVPSPALSACTLNTTISYLPSSVAAYAPTVQRSTYAMDSFPPLPGTQTASFNHLSASARPESLSYSNYQGNHVGPSSGTLNSRVRPALSLNTSLRSDASSVYSFNNTITAHVPLSSSRDDHGQFSASASISPAQQLAHSDLSPVYGQGEALLIGPGHYNYTGDYGSYEGMPTNSVNITYSPALQSYLGGTEQYPSYTSNDSYPTGYQCDNGFGRSLDIGSQSTTSGHHFNPLNQVNTFNTIAVPSPTALAREALAAMGSMASCPYSEQESEGYSG